MLRVIHKIGVRYFKAYSLNMLYLICPQIIAAVAAIIALPLILNNIPKADYGKLQFVLAISGWLAAFTFIRISTESKIGIARGQYGNFFYAIFSRSKLFLPVAIVSFAISFALMYIDLGVFGWLLCLSTLILFSRSILLTTINNFLIAENSFGWFAVLESVSFALSQIASVVAAVKTQSIVFMLLVRVLVSLFCCTTALFFMLKKYDLWGAYRRKEYDVKIRSYGIKMLPSNLSVLTRQHLSSILIGTIFGFNIFAEFSIAYNLMYRKAIELVKKITPLLYSKEAKNGAITLKFQKTKFFIFMTIASFSFSFFVICISLFYIHNFLPSEYDMANRYVTILMFSLPFVILTQFLVLSFSVKMDHKSLNKISIGRTAIELFCILILGYFFKINGVCFGITIGAIAGFIIAFLQFKKKNTGDSTFADI